MKDNNTFHHHSDTKFYSTSPTKFSAITRSQNTCPNRVPRQDFQREPFLQNPNSNSPLLLKFLIPPPSTSINHGSWSRNLIGPLHLLRSVRVASCRQIPQTENGDSGRYQADVRDRGTDPAGSSRPAAVRRPRSHQDERLHPASRQAARVGQIPTKLLN